MPRLPNEQEVEYHNRLLGLTYEAAVLLDPTEFALRATLQQEAYEARQKHLKAEAERKAEAEAEAEQKAAKAAKKKAERKAVAEKKVEEEEAARRAAKKAKKVEKRKEAPAEDDDEEGEDRPRKKTKNAEAGPSGSGGSEREAAGLFATQVRRSRTPTGPS